MDDLALLTDGIVRLADDPELRYKLAQAAREMVERDFTLKRYKSEIVTQIDSMS